MTNRRHCRGSTVVDITISFMQRAADQSVGVGTMAIHDNDFGAGAA